MVASPRKCPHFNIFVEQLCDETNNKKAIAVNGIENVKGLQMIRKIKVCKVLQSFVTTLLYAVTPKRKSGVTIEQLCVI